MKMNAEMKQDLHDFILDIVETLVDDTEAVSLNSIENSSLVAFELSVAPDDIGKIIGAKGDTIRAIRHLLVCAARKRGIRVNLDLLGLTPSPRE
jgi:predicted RNA-binding protein YlqC (UPF0109 family)